MPEDLRARSPLKRGDRAGQFTGNPPCGHENDAGKRVRKQGKGQLKHDAQNKCGLRCGAPRNLPGCGNALDVLLQRKREGTKEGERPRRGCSASDVTVTPCGIETHGDESNRQNEREPLADMGEVAMTCLPELFTGALAGHDGVAQVVRSENTHQREWKTHHEGKGPPHAAILHHGRHHVAASRSGRWSQIDVRLSLARRTSS